MVSKQKFLRYLSYFSILLVVVFLSYFITETTDAIRSLSIPGKVGFILFLVSIVWLIVRSVRLSNAEESAEKDKSRYYIFRVEKHPQYSHLSLDTFMAQHGMGEDFFWQTIAIPAINSGMEQYRREHSDRCL